MANLNQELQDHFKSLKDDPTTSINERLIETCCQVLPQQLSQPDSVALVKGLSALVPTVQNDPTLLNKLLIALLEPYSFSDILSLSENVDFVSGLNVQAVPYNRLLLSILRKATLRSSDASTVASRPEILSSLVTLWLSTPEPGIAQEAGEVFSGLLEVDHQNVQDSTSSPPGLVWKRVFQDKDVYSLFYSICVADPRQSTHDISRNQRTLAQSRLLEVLPNICALDWQTVSRSHFKDVEEKYVGPSPQAGTTPTGLLGFATQHMVDTKDDVLMHKCLVEFFADLIATVNDTGMGTQKGSSLSLDYLLESGIHDRITDLYVDPNERKHGMLEVQFLYSSAAKYVAIYASIYQSHFMGSKIRGGVLRRLENAIDQSPSRWAHQESPRHDLHVLSSLPRVALLPDLSSAGRSIGSIIRLLPSKQTNPDALNTLATIFQGPNKVESLTYPEESPMTSSIDERGLAEAQAARALYFLYVTRYNTYLFADLVAHADSVALTDVALAAINVISSIITSTWAPLSEKALQGMITESEFIRQLPEPTPATPTSGVQAILAPPSLEHTLPWLLKPARSFANLVGGRGDTESVANKVAVAKHETLRAMYNRLKVVADNDSDQGYQDILETLRKSIARGPWSQGGDVGGRVATMEL
ncbi:hypothetical protein C1H76_2328 [Elsinoe australis]|uniref:DNA mismatch repair protein HSM3 N-terminal domain-containing protein n=1 Tax=Elsinoe australis TaxID=40998 RepID=A0A4U7B324_9PEZI|nr:hypothetical protein C1H76_2328 [Elsinoe australis]